MEVWLAKVISLTSLLVITVIFGLLPLKMVRLVSPVTGGSHVCIMSLLNCLAGGVFLGTFMLHLQPEVYRMSVQYGMVGKLPYTNILISCGFFLILIIEQIFLHISNRYKDGLCSHPSRGTALEDLSDISEDSNDDILDYGSTERSSRFSGFQKTRVILFLTALATHSIFEGLAMGLQETEMLVWTVFLAITTHKSIIAFSTGVQLVRTYHPSVAPVVIGICVFSAMTPCGATLGAVISGFGVGTDSHALGTVIVVLQGLAAGSFMFITFIEILVKNLRSKGNPIIKTVTVVVGFLCVFGLLALYEDP